MGQSAIGNRQLAIGWPTRYRVVVLTSWDRRLSEMRVSRFAATAPNNDDDFRDSTLEV